MKRKPPLRWDKIVGIITVLVMLLFSVIIYSDLKNGGSSRAGVTINSSLSGNKQENTVLSGSQQSIDTSQGSSQQSSGNTSQGGSQQSSNTSQSTAAGSTTSKAENASVITVSGKPVVCIDAGHGGSDIGVSDNGKNEKTQVLEIAKLVKQYLEKSGVSVVMTRTQDTDVTNEQRVKTCNSSNAVAMVSLHRNVIENNSSVNGIEAWIHSNKNEKATKLSNYILKEINSELGIKNRGVKSGTMKDTSDNYYINSQSKCTSLILELGFITSRTDDVMFEGKINQTAQAISDGIVKYLKELGY